MLPLALLEGLSSVRWLVAKRGWAALAKGCGAIAAGVAVVGLLVSRRMSRFAVEVMGSKAGGRWGRNFPGLESLERAVGSGIGGSEVKGRRGVSVVAVVRVSVDGS